MSRLVALAAAAGRLLDTLFAWPLRGLVRLYQVTLAHWFSGQCRFHPSCSHYGLEALRNHGAARGTWLTACRILKCHPLHPGGYDPVPPRVGTLKKEIL